MADRQTKVSLSIQMQQYIDGMNKAAKATRETATEAAKLAQQREQFQLLGRAALTAGALVGAGLAVAVAKFADFDQAMSNVAATGQDAKDNIDALRDAALEAGATTVFTASESANAIEDLAKAGLDASEILGGALKGSLDLAAAGGIGVAEAAGIAATTLQQFKLEGEDATHVADLLAAGAGKAMGDVGDMSQALKQSGLVADQFGVSVEETVGTLSAFASAGLLGSDAGTSFRTMLLRLANPTGEVRDLMKEIGFEAYNAQGQFIGLAGLAGELETSLAGMTDEQKQTTLAMIFGQDAIRGATVLYEEGAEGIAEWTDKVDDAGYAAETAATRLDNLKGDWEAFSGAVDTALISMGEAADGPLRGFVQMLTGLVDKFNEMPPAGQQAVFWVAAVGGAGASALGSYLLLVPKVAEFNTALEILGPRAQTASKWVGLITKVAGGAAVGMLAAVTAADLLTDALAAIGDAAEVTDNKVRTAASGIELLDAANAALSVSNVALAAEQIERLGDVLDGVGRDGSGGIISATTLSAVQQLGAELGDLAGTELPAAQRQFALLADQAGLTEKQQLALLDQMEPYKKALTEQATAAGVAVDGQVLLDSAFGDSEESTKDNERALRDLSGQADTTVDDITTLSDAIRGFGSATLNTRDAQRQFEQSLDDLTESVKENGATLDITTQAGRDNQAAVDDLATSTLELSASTLEQTGSQEDANKVIADGRQRLIDMLGQFGITGDAAEEYADELGLIPSNVNTAVAVTGVDTAQVKIQRLRDTLNSIPNYKGITVDTIIGNPSMGGGAIPGHADGGAVYGPGGPRDDKVLRRLSPGEHVLDAGDVAAMGGQHAVYAWRESLHSGGSAGGSGGSPAVYVQNPFTGEYLLAQVSDVAAGVTDSGLRETFAPLRGRRR